MHDPLSAPPDPLLSPRKSRRGLFAIVLAVVLVLGLGAWWYFTRTPEGATADGQAKGDASKGDAKKGAGKGGRGNFASGPQPVAAATARKGDIRIIQTSLGTVNALNTATVRTRVDGPLLAVLFREGQSVKAGDVLAQVDPAPFEVALSQAEGRAGAEGR